MKRRINNSIKNFVVLLICLIGNTVLAVEVNNWTDLKANEEAGKSVTLSDNITADSSSTTISIGSSISPVLDLATKYISGNNLVQIFSNAGTLSILNGTIENAISATSGGAIYNSGSATINNTLFDNNTATNYLGGAIYSTASSSSAIATLTINDSDFKNNNSYNGGAIYNSYSNLTINDSKFSENACSSTSSTWAYASGGAIYNCSRQDGEGITSSCIIGNSSFNNTTNTATLTGDSGSSFAEGGVIYSGYGALTVSGSAFKENASTVIATLAGENSSIQASGGVIFNEAYSITNISDSSFESNRAIATSTADNTSTQSYGGVIYTQFTSYDNYRTTCSNLIFTNNSASATSSGAGSDTESFGGAISIYDDSVILTNSNFTNNSAIASTTGEASRSFASGGAIVNLFAELKITNSKFTNNSASASATGSGSVVGAYGGAILNYNGNLYITNSTFTDNSVSANATGGLSTVETYGGAIYNSGALYLVADGGITSFTGNTDATGSNAIYTSDGGFVNLNAGNGGYILFNDAITSDNASNKLNINSGVTLTSGNVIFNNIISNYAVTLNNGMLTLGQYENPKTTSYFSNVALNLTGGILNTANGNMDTNTLALFSSTYNKVTNVGAGLFFDVDFQNGTQKNDIFNITALTTGSTAAIKGVNIISDSLSAGTTSLGIFNIPASTILNTTAVNAYTNDYKYTVASSTNGTIGFTRGDLGTGGLPAAVADTSTYRSFSATKDESTPIGGLGEMAGANSTLTVFGNNQNINGNSHSGITVESGQTLNIYDVGTSSTKGMNGFSNIDGGAINNAGMANIIASTFTNNAVTSEGGAIYNIGTLNVTDSYFGAGNHAGYGGAIYSGNGGVVNISGSTFNKNTANIYGGAIEGYGNSVLNISNSTFTNNYAVIDSGAVEIWTGSSSANIYDSTFTNNSSAGTGGAIGNWSTSGTMNIYNSTFTNNSSDKGGAIYNTENTTITGGTFTKNSALTYGGAIYNDGGTLAIKAHGSEVAFSGNSAGIAGNDIYMNGGTLSLNPLAVDDKITFADGIASSSVSSIITKQGGGQLMLSGDNSGFTQTFTQTEGTTSLSNKFFAGTNNIQGGTLNFNDGASTSKGSSINLSNSAALNINANTGNTFELNSTLAGTGTQIVTKNNGGIVNANSAISGIMYNQNAGTTNFKNTVKNSTVNIYGGTLNIANESYFDVTDNLGLYGSTINTQNGMPGTLALGALTLAGGSTHNWLMDVDLANALADKITATSVSGTGNLTISNINLLSDANSKLTSVNVANAVTKGHIDSNVSSVNGALYKYLVSYDGSAGNLNFTQNGISPLALTGNVAQTQAFLLQTAIDKQFFANTESFMSFPLATRESTICCALSNGNTTGAACPISGNGTFSPIYSCDLNRGIWVKTFTSFENIPLQNGPNVSTIEYGTLIGADAPLTYLKRGWVGNTSAYVGYLGSNQNYDGVGVSQNGVLVGLAENMIKGNNFLTLMANVGSSIGIANTQYGNDYFSMIYAGAAAKSGHNFEFKDGEYIIQPSLMLAYTYTYTPNYNTASGIEMTSQPLNAVQVVPGIRLIKNLTQEKGQVYLICNFIYNIMDNSRFSANDVQLPELSVAPYVEYGIGYQRVWKERFTGFFQTILRGGGRNGVALQFGMRWAI